MGINNLKIEIYANPEEAPVYRTPEFQGASLEVARVVKQGTTGGKSTVDLIFVDKKGQKFIAMITTALIRSIVEVSGEAS